MSKRVVWNDWGPPFGEPYLQEPVGPGKLGVVRWAPTFEERVDEILAPLREALAELNKVLEEN